MQCSRDEFLTTAEAWRGKLCALSIITEEIGGGLLATFVASSQPGLLQFSCHPLLQPFTIDLSRATEFEFGVPERESELRDAELVGRVADEMLLARIPGKLVFSMTRLTDPLAGILQD